MSVIVSFITPPYCKSNIPTPAADVTLFLKNIADYKTVLGNTRPYGNFEIRVTLPLVTPIKFNVYGSVHRKYILLYVQQDAALHILFISGNCSTCFGLYHHPSSGAHTTVSTASGICHTVTAICRYRGGVGTAVPTPPR